MKDLNWPFVRKPLKCSGQCAARHAWFMYKLNILLFPKMYLGPTLCGLFINSYAALPKPTFSVNDNCSVIKQLS